MKSLYCWGFKTEDEWAVIDGSNRPAPTTDRHSQTNSDGVIANSPSTDSLIDEIYMDYIVNKNEQSRNQSYSCSCL